MNADFFYESRRCPWLLALLMAWTSVVGGYAAKAIATGPVSPDKPSLQEPAGKEAAPPVTAERARDFDKWTRLKGEAATLVAQGEHEKAAAVIAEERKELARAEELGKEAMKLLQQRRPREAIPLAKESADIQKRLLGENHQAYAKSLHNLAAMYGSMGNDVRAVPLYRQALEIEKKVLGENHPACATTMTNLGGIYRAERDYLRAEPLLSRAVEIRKKALGEGHPDYAKSLNNLALMYHCQGNYARAEPLYRRALELEKQLLGENHPLYALHLNNMAALYTGMGDTARAESLLRQALEIQSKIFGENHPDRALTMLNLAEVYDHRRDYARAEPLYRQVLEIGQKTAGEDGPNYDTNLNNLAMCYEAQGDYTRAEPLLRQAVAITRRHLEATSVIQSERQQLATLQSARCFLDNYLSVATHVPGSGGAAYREMLAWKGGVFRRERLARMVGESPELAPAFRQLQEVVTRWVRLARAAPDPEQDSGWRERLGQLAEERERLEAELFARSAAYRRARKDVTPEEVQDALPANAALVDFLVRTVCKITPGKNGRNEARMAKMLLAAVVRKSGPVEIVDLGEADSVEDAVKTWRADFGTSPQGAGAGELLRKRIWDPLEPRFKDARIVLVSPDDFLGRLPLGALPAKEPGRYLIEDRAIAVVPVPQLLPALASGAARKKLKKNLLLVGDIDYDADPGKQPRGTPPAALAPLLAANRAARGDRFAAIPGTRDEIDSIARMYRHNFPTGDDLTMLARGAATKRAFWGTAPQHASIHVATHGFFAPPEIQSALATPLGPPGSPRRPGETVEAQGYSPGLLSGLALTGANQAAAEGKRGSPDNDGTDNGILTADEIASMNLEGVDLVVLSACETGLGKAAGGEGLLGLQRSFQSSGVETVVASLWKVDDTATQTLMAEFYRNLWEKKLGKLEALRQAQLTMLRQYDAKGGRLRGPGDVRPVDPAKLAAAKEGGGQRLSPFYWAAFVLSGGWK